MVCTERFVLNNSDPQLEFRLQLIARDVSNVPLFCAEACVPSDQVTLPSIGDTVWVMFEAGDIQKPVWVGVRPRRAA
jgi:Type VI secretion system/phage-baseplate injector OB domain